MFGRLCVLLATSENVVISLLSARFSYIRCFVRSWNFPSEFNWESRNNHIFALLKITNLIKKKLSFHKHNVFEEIDPQIPTLGMLTYIDFYCISEHLGAWDRGNMNILKIGTKMTSGSLRFPNWIPRGAQFWRSENGEVEQSQNP